MDDKNVVKKRVTLAIAFAVFLLAVIVIIVLIKPVIFKVKDNNRAEVSEQTQKEAEEYLKVYYRSLVIDKCEMSVKEYEPETNSEYISYVKAGDEAYSYASYVFYGTMDTPDAKGDSVIIYMLDSVKSPYYSINGNDKWNMSIVQNKPDGAKTWNYAFTER